MLNFQGVLPQKETLGATFNETRALSSVKYVAQQGINVPIFLEIYELIGLHFFQKILSIMFIFDVFFPWRRFFGCIESIRDSLKQFEIISALAAIVAAVISLKMYLPIMTLIRIEAL